jgi:transcriptional regulator with XRE-family HTH domain
VKPADDIFYRELGRRIRTFRTQQGLTQAGLGLRLDPPVTRAAIANVENGKQRVLAHTLVQFAQILRVEIHGLVPTLSSPRSASAQQQVLERELKKKLMVSRAVMKRLSARLVSQS